MVGKISGLATSPNTGFAAHFVRPNAFGTSQIREPLSAIALKREYI